MARTKNEKSGAAKPAKCLRCDQPATTRGLCIKHYNKLAYRVNQGELSWAEAEKAGACLPAREQESFADAFPMLAKPKSKAAK